MLILPKRFCPLQVAKNSYGDTHKNEKLRLPTLWEKVWTFSGLEDTFKGTHERSKASVRYLQ